jgi:hypothetical protein
VQVVIALIVTPEGFPLAYEVMAGNTSDKKTLDEFVRAIQDQYGKAERIWVMDRGIPTEKTLAAMRAADPPIRYLVGTPRGRLSRLEGQLLGRPWQEVREGIEVKFLEQGPEVYVQARSRDRVGKERRMRRRQLKRLWRRLGEWQGMKLARREQLWMKLGAARQQAPAAWRLVEVKLARQGTRFTYSLRKVKLREVRRREGHYLLRAHRCGEAPEPLWQFYIQLTHVEEAFQNLKGDLALRPIFHQRQSRIEAHIFVAFLAYSACTSPCNGGCGIWRRDSRPARCWRNSVRCK